MENIRPCRENEFEAIYTIINSAAERYRGVIPEDRWHDPYMPMDQLTREMDAGIAFWGLEENGRLAGIMGIQSIRDVMLIRHAYVLPRKQGKGIGGALLQHLCEIDTRPMLIGTWADAAWAIRFYQRNGFTLVAREQVATLLRAYWSIPERQIETSVVLSDTPIDKLEAMHSGCV